MAKLQKAFDSGQHEDMRDGFDPIPKAKYLMKIVESSVKDTKKKTGKYIEFKFEVMKGDYKGRLVWKRLNIINPNPVAVEISEQELATLCRACGKNVIQDTQELHDIPVFCKVKIVPESKKGPATNDITFFEPATIGASSSAPTEDEEILANDDVPWGDD